MMNAQERELRDALVKPFEETRLERMRQQARVEPPEEVLRLPQRTPSRSQGVAQVKEETTMKRKKLPRGVFVRNREYWIRYSDREGLLHREKVGPFLKPAVDAYRKRKTEVREGKFFPDQLRRRLVRFPELVQDFHVHSRQSEKRDSAHEISRAGTLLRLWRDVPLAELTPGRIEGDLAQCAEEEEWAPATFNRYRALVSGIFSVAIRNGKATVNPVRGTEHREENNERVRYLTDEEEARLLALVRATCPAREAEITVALHSGMRRSEQYVTAACPDGGLKWEHIDFRTGVITLPRSKHGKRRHIPMNSLLRETLRELHKTAKSAYVFPVYPPDEWFPELCQQAGIANFRWHDTRHTFASRLVMAGVDLNTVKELLGHRSIATTVRYAHLAPRHLREAVARLVSPTDTATSTGTLASETAQLAPVA
jgi:integrase